MNRFLSTTIAIAVPIFCFSSLSLGEQNLEGLRFSNTQTLGKNEASFVEKYRPKLVEIDNVLNLVPAPATNLSRGTISELKELLRLQEIRTEADEELIEKQKRFCRFDFPHYKMGQNRILDDLLKDTFLDTSYYIFKLKVFHDRVRPNFLTPELRPSIRNPPHPAYPSGHGGQSMIVALVLSHMFAEYQKDFLALAENIGSNRELAGVHYRSDTVAGQTVAKKYFEKLVEADWFADKVEAINKAGFDGKPMTVSRCEGYLAAALSPYRGAN